MDKRLTLSRGRPAPRTAFKKGDPRINRKGRPKGSKNLFTRDILQSLLNAFEKVGGEDYLAKSAKLDRRSFLALLGRAMPTQITGKDGGPLDVLVGQAEGKLGNLSDAELATLEALLKKIGLSGAVVTPPDDTGGEK